MKSSLWISFVGAAAVLALAASTGCSGGGGGAKDAPGCTKVQPTGFPTTAQGTAVGDTSPDIQLVDENNVVHCLRDYTGEVVLINTGAGWCPPCRDEAPLIENAYKTYHAQGFEVFMGMLDDYTNNGTMPDPSTFLKQWEKAYGLTFLAYADPQGKIFNDYDQGQNAIPASAIVDRDHVVRFLQVGGLTSSQLNTTIQTYLNQPATLNYGTNP